MTANSSNEMSFIGDGNCVKNKWLFRNERTSFNMCPDLYKGAIRPSFSSFLLMAVLRFVHLGYRLNLVI